ncbi:exopolyphosphatase [Nocardioides perillae]|uniref:Exopolyphosphatase/guanosine-5'-triphosphate, 3'-diphosphate pyrophosphatase n=1 Tax=Nocardioides perillae TaxID=1119534 RepID=A0A7Y9RYD0_9ACTN|nr:exopolyphosphatase/guanosine-5'-triphosphate,3'-diphosphate pyrophosphatase [Nocardioides perillae]
MSRARVAAVDCGTNTVKLLVGEVVDGALVELARESRMVRLGQGVDRTGRLDEAALARAFAALDEYADLLRHHDVARVRFCATSATRDAANADVFTAGVRARLGVEPEVLPGAAEAALSFAGAVRHLHERPDGPVLVVDIGGGSTELVLGRAGGAGEAGAVTHARSADVGSVRLHERLLHDDPATPEQVAACRAAVDAALDEVVASVGAGGGDVDGERVPVTDAVALVGVAGTVTTVAAHVLGLSSYDRRAIDQSVVATGDVLAAVDELVAMSAEQRRQLPYVHPGRADVLDAGALVLGQVVRRVGLPTLTVSEADILDGIAWSLVDA